MTHHVLTMAGKGTDAEWLIATLLRTAKTRGLLPYSTPVVQTSSLSDARAALNRETGLTAIITSVHPRKLVHGERLPKESIDYLSLITSYRSAVRPGAFAPHVPLILLGNYNTDDSPPAYESLRHAAAIVRPDVCIVERKYGRPPFSSHLYSIAQIFADPQKYQEQPHVLIPRSELVTEVQKATTPGYGPGGINSIASWRLDFVPLPSSFMSHADAADEGHASSPAVRQPTRTRQ